MKAGRVIADRYVARDRVGRGGMGEVWRCNDRARGRDVAVKVVRAGALDHATARLFRDEVMATARLDHPSIARVYDLVQSEDGLALVMELRAGQPLSRLAPLPFEALREASCQILEALAYAHARGLLHLDIKPDNVLLDDRDGQLRATLLDFGIARAWRRDTENADAVERIMGTLTYMAPEQLTGKAARFGPWTDLYAFGAMLYRVVSGARPFEGRALAQRMLRPPRLNVSPACPVELVDLVQSLMAPRQRDRPTHAADVLSAMRALPLVAGDCVELPDLVEPETASASGLGLAVASELSTATARARDPVTAETRPSGFEAMAETGTDDSRRSTLPIAEPPAAPYRPREEPAPGAYALFGLRDLPVVGRAEERQRIWEQLVAVRKQRKTRVIALRGGPGTGKSRLARDAIERAHEAGLAHTAWSSWSEGGGAGNEGLRQLLEHALAAGSAPEDELSELVSDWASQFTGSDDERFCTDVRLFLQPGGGLTDADLPLRVTAEALGRLAESRAAAIWLDDIHWSRGDARALIERLRERGDAVAVIVTSTRSAEDGTVADAEIDMDALDESSTLGLIRGLLDLSPELTEEVARRSDGNPLFATQLVGELIEQDALERAGTTYALRPDFEPASIPEDLPSIWERRLARAGLDPVHLCAVAITRARVSDELVSRLAQRRGADLVDQVQGAVRAGLLLRQGDQYAWTHGLLRDHLRERAPRDQRRALHRDAAFALAGVVGVEDVQAERAEHLFAAGQPERACDAMQQALAWSFQRADADNRERRALTLLEWATQNALHSHRARALAELAHRDALRGDTDAARRRSDSAARAQRDAKIDSPWVALRRAQVASVTGRDSEAEAAARHALEAARRQGETEVETQALGHLALAAHRRRDVGAARQMFERAAELARSRGDSATEARAKIHLANMAPVDSLPLFEQALQAALRAGARRVELQARQVYADALYLRGEKQRARAEMETVGAQARALRMRQLVSIAEIQLACWALRESDTERAAEHRDAALAAGAAEGGRVERCMAAGISAAVAVMRDQPAVAQDALEQLASERGDYDEEELREVLRIAQQHAGDLLADQLAAALAERGR